MKYNNIIFLGLCLGLTTYSALSADNVIKVPLGLSATYGQTGNKVSAGTVQSVIGVTFIYE
ncbi:hypothetical protein HH184_004657 [Escherichia coli]|nr:hypothetical protein [Escherichia coli]